MSSAECEAATNQSINRLIHSRQSDVATNMLDMLQNIWRIGHFSYNRSMNRLQEPDAPPLIPTLHLPSSPVAADDNVCGGRSEVMRDYGSLRLGLSESWVWFRCVFSGCGLLIFRQRLSFCTFVGRCGIILSVRCSEFTAWLRLAWQIGVLVLLSPDCLCVTRWSDSLTGNSSLSELVILPELSQTRFNSNVHVTVNKRSNLETVSSVFRRVKIASVLRLLNTTSFFFF